MHALTLTLLLAAPTLVRVEVRTLGGEQHTGVMESLSAETLRLGGEAGVELPVSSLHELRVTSTEREQPRPTQEAEIIVQLHDGSRLGATAFSASRRTVQLTSRSLGETKLPRVAVKSVRLQSLDSSITDAWMELADRETDKDLLVRRKGDLLDYIDGVVGTIDNKSVSLLLDDAPIPVPRERVFGIVYAAEGRTLRAPLCRIDLWNGDRIAPSSLRFSGDAFTLTLAGDATGELLASAVERIDFSLGKIRYLGDEEPDDVRYPTDHPRYDPFAWALRRNCNSAGRPLRVGGQSYDRGLWIHSGTTLRYRLGRQYRWFRAIMDMDEDIGDYCDPSVGVVIRGDGRVLLQEELKWSDEPRPLELDVAGVRDLEIDVLSHDPEGVCEHLDLAEARVIK